MAVDLENDMAARAAELERFVRDWYQHGVNEGGWRDDAHPAVRAAWAKYEQAFGDLHVAITDLTVVPDASGEDEVTVWHTFTGTFVGEFDLGDGKVLPPSGKHVELHGVSQLRLKEWQLVGGKDVTDMLGVLGVIPEQKT